MTVLLKRIKCTIIRGMVTAQRNQTRKTNSEIQKERFKDSLIYEVETPNKTAIYEVFSKVN